MKLSSILIGLSILFSVFFASTSYAADARNYNAGRIIDDSVFTNSYSMTVQDIQNFLNSKVQCDTWGTKPSEYGGGTRAQYAASRGVSTPFTCLKDYYQNPTTGEDNYGKSVPAGGISSAQIIFNYSRQFNINPQVLLVTLQKENGLITDEWPFPKQYRESMGFGCPDNVAPGAPACNPSYGSFSAQIYEAARHFKGYMDNGTGWYIPFDTGWNSVMWSPNQPVCGAGDVYIENRATVALYSYTPYQPNQAARNAQYGTGDSCSAYGNRNFFLYFTDWFGSVTGDVHMVSSLNLMSSSPGSLFTNGFVEASFVIRNDSDQWRDVGYIAVAVRDENGVNYDLGGEYIKLAPRQEFLYRKARNFTSEGKYTFWVTSYRESVGWDDNYPSSVNGSIRKHTGRVVQNKPTITTSLQADSELREGKQSNVNFIVKSNSKYPTNLGYLGVVMRDPEGNNVDLPFETISSLAPQSQYQYSKPFTPKKSGIYRASISSYIDNSWFINYPAAADGVITKADLNVKQNPTITQSLSVPSEVYAGDSPNVGFKIKNHSQTAVDAGYLAVAVRDPDNQNVDISGVSLSNLAANGEHTFTGTRKFTKPGIYTAWVVSYKNGIWSDKLPVEEDSSIKKKITFEVKGNPVLSEGMTIKRIGTNTDINNARAGDTLEGSFTIKNRSSQEVSVNKNLCYILRGNSKNYDVGCLAIGNLSAYEEKTFTAQRVIGTAGSYRGYFSMYDGGWRDNQTFNLENGDEATTVQFTAWASPTLVQGLTVNGQNPSTGSFAVKNQANTPAQVNKLLCMIVRREGDSTNYDLGCLDLKTMQANEVQTFNGQRMLPTGSYKAYFSSYYDNMWHDNTSFVKEVGTEATLINFSIN
ncbi:MAG: hypothetical protein ABIQ64_01390 [Candidatus Saccharimonadales bacterium]